VNDFIEDLFAFLTVTGEPVTCSRCGKNFLDGEQYTLDEDNQVVCPDCEEVERPGNIGAPAYALSGSLVVISKPFPKVPRRLRVPLPPKPQPLPPGRLLRLDVLRSIWPLKILPVRPGESLPHHLLVDVSPG
jgi:hypothetical protein